MSQKILFNTVTIALFIGVLAASGYSAGDTADQVAAMTDHNRNLITEIAGNSWKAEEKDGALNFLMSLLASKTGSDTINEALASVFASRVNTTGTREEKLASFRALDEKTHPFFVEALKLGRRVPDTVLDKIHPQLQQHFHKEYIKSLEQRVANTGENWKPFDQSQKYYEQWFEWASSHAEEFDLPYEIEDETNE